MTDQHDTTTPAGAETPQPTLADTVTDPTMVPMDDDAGGPTADKEESSDERAETALGGLA